MNQLNLEELLSSAARLFAEHGYDGTGIREIANVSGTPSTSIYYHFKSKQELYRESLEARYEEAFEKVSQAVAEADSAVEKMDMLVETILDLFAHNKVLLTLVQRDIVDTLLSDCEPLIKGYHQRYMRLIGEFLAEQAERPVDSRAAVTVASLIFGYSELMFISSESGARACPEWLAEQKRYLKAQVRCLCAVLAGAA